MHMTDRELLNLAREAAGQAYVPYSRFPRGAALECSDGTVYTGCTLECASLPQTLCAEHAAVAAAVTAGHRDFSRLAVWGEGEAYALPCGSCLQVLSEFSRDMEVLAAKAGARYVSYRVSQLLPHPGKG